MSTVTLDIADGVALITLNRPERMNTLGGSMKDDLRAAFLDLARNDANVRAVIITGSGDRAFCAGADIKERAGTKLPLPEYHLKQKATHELFRAIEQFEKPVIAAINGPAVGVGATMLLPMDIRIASSDARFGFVFARRGITPEACSSWFLPRVVGISQALEWTMTGRVFSAQEALEGGLVRKVVAPEALLETARAMIHCARWLSQSSNEACSPTARRASSSARDRSAMTASWIADESWGAPR